MDKSINISIRSREAIVVLVVCCVIFVKYFRDDSLRPALDGFGLPAMLAPELTQSPAADSSRSLPSISSPPQINPSRYRSNSSIQLASAQFDIQSTPWTGGEGTQDDIAIDLEEIRPLDDDDDDDFRSPENRIGGPEGSGSSNKNPAELPEPELPEPELPEIADLDVESEVRTPDDVPLDDIKHQSLEEFLNTLITTPITTATHKVTWSLDDAINAALLYSYQVDSLRIETVENFQQIGVEFGQFDATTFLEQSFRDSNTPVGNNFEVAGPAERIRGENLNVQYGLRQELISGGQIELSQTFGTRDDDSGVLSPPNQANSSLSLSLSKEVLRGSGRSIGLSQVLIAKHNAQAGKLNNIAAISNLLEEVSNAYWDIFSARAELIAAIETAQQAENILSDLEARTNLDADPNLLEQARVSSVQQRAQADIAYAALARAQFELVQLVNAPELLQNIQRIEIIPTGINFDTFESPDVVSRQNTAIHNRTEIQSVVQNIRRAQIEHQFSINELLPRLAFSAEGIFEGLSGNRDLSAANENQFDSDATYELGVNFEFPLQNRAARFQKRRAELVLARLNQDWKTAVEGVKRDVLVAIQDVETNQSLVSRQRAIFDSSLQRLTFLEQRRFRIPEAGSIPSLQLGQLLDVQSQMAQSKSAFASALADRERSRFSLNRVTGILVAPITQGLDNPGTHNFLSIYRQSFEGNQLYQSHSRQIADEVRSVSRKEHTTWRGNTFGYPQPEVGATIETSSYHQVIQDPNHSSQTLHTLQSHIHDGGYYPGQGFQGPSEHYDLTPTSSEGDIYSPGLSRSNQSGSGHTHASVNPPQTSNPQSVARQSQSRNNFQHRAQTQFHPAPTQTDADPRTYPNVDPATTPAQRYQHTQVQYQYQQPPSQQPVGLNR